MSLLDDENVMRALVIFSLLFSLFSLAFSIWVFVMR